MPEKIILNLTTATLRPWKKEDISSLVQNANNEKIFNNVRDIFPHPYTKNDAKKWIEFTSIKGQNINLAIEAEGKAVGAIGIFFFEDVYCRTCEVGYWLGEAYWNRGIVSEAVRELVAFVFSNYPIVRVYAGVFENNIASKRVLEKAGFHLECIHKKAVFKNGQILDEYVYVQLSPRAFDPIG